MRIEIAHYEDKHIAEISDESNISELMENIYNLVISTGYAKESLDNWILSAGEDILIYKNGK